TIYPTQSCETEADVCWIDRLTGDKSVRMQIEDGVDPDEIIAGWQGDLEAFDASTEPYRLYADDGEDPGADAEADSDGTDEADATDAADGTDEADGTDAADGQDASDDASDDAAADVAADGSGADATAA